MKTLREQKENKCRHFSGLMNTLCKAGVNYDTVKVSGGPGKGYQLPCFKDHNMSDKCDKCSFKTSEEIDAEMAESAKRFHNFVTARAAIVVHAGGRIGVAGSLPCPICTTGELSYTIAGCNGHVHARCSTPNCVLWME